MRIDANVKSKGEQQNIVIPSLTPNVRNKIKLCSLTSERTETGGYIPRKKERNEKMRITEFIKKGIKWTITPAVNDKTGEKLGFVPFELFSKMTASAFQAEYQRETGTADIVAVRPQNIARCAFACAEMLKTYGGKAATKVRNICEDVAIINAVNATDDAMTECAKINADIRRAEKQAERAALIGVSPEKMANERAGLDALRAELEDAKITLAQARKNENALCAKKVAELFPTFSDNETENK